MKRFFTRWYGWAIRSRLAPVKQVAKTLKRHLAGVLRFVQHPITNGVAEGLNSKTMSIKRKAGGFRNPSHFTTAIYFHCGGQLFVQRYQQRFGSGMALKPSKRRLKISHRPASASFEGWVKLPFENVPDVGAR